ncbi:ATP-binding protein [Maricaulis sp.]|uniref:ATP-binding protein n=1 Tax=Maricaulis sp. TaxID=1486257 RepID=UPI0032988D52
MRKLWELAWPPVRDGDILRAARERMLNIMAITVAVLGGIAGALNLSANIHTYPVQAIAGLVIPLSAISIPVIARDPRLVKPAGIALCIVLYGLVAGMIGTIGGMYHPAAIYFVGLPVPAAFLIGHRAGLITAGLCCLTMLGFYFFGGAIENPFLGLISAYQVGWITIVLFILTLGVGIAASVFQHELEGAGRALDRARQSANAANRAKSDFLAGMSHEIRTPMNAVLGMAQALEQADIPEAHKRQAETLARSGRLLLRLVNDVLDLSKIEAGKLEIEATRFNLADVAGTVEALYGPAAREKGVGFSIALSEGAQEDLIGDPVRISQILNNLVSNAIKFTAEGEVRVEIDCERAPGSPDRDIRITVRDTGIGIAAPEVERLFQPFTQAEPGTARTFGGTGLGLAICRRLCELMSGEIEVDSTPGAGSTFSVRLRVDPADTAAPVLDCGCPSVLCDTALRGRRLRVLAADDNLTNRMVLKALLADVTETLVMVEDGQQALDALANGDFDLVLMDSQMPVLDGITATRQLREREAAAGRTPVPVYAVTANVMQAHVNEYVSAGMTGVIAKPISREALLEVLGQHTHNAVSPAELRHSA